MSPGRFFTAAAVLLVGVLVVVGIGSIDAPGTARAKRLDKIREAALSSISQDIDRFWQETGALPRGLTELPRHVFQRVTDPETGLPFDYEIVASRSYRLCATFARDTRKDSERHRSTVNFDKDRFRLNQEVVRDWGHPSGRHCFEISLPQEGGIR